MVHILDAELFHALSDARTGGPLPGLYLIAADMHIFAREQVNDLVVKYLP